MPHPIIKLCADSLRSRYKTKRYLPELKSSHAHELIAAFFGYRSKIAMNADKQYPISHLNKADFLILPPYDENVAQIFEPRLETLGITCIDAYDVLSIVKDILHKEKIPAYDQPLAEIAVGTAKRRLRDRFLLLSVDIDDLNLNIEVTGSDITVSEASFAVSANYLSDTGKKTAHYSTMTIRFPRISGRVGYQDPDIRETPAPPWPYPAGTLVMCREPENP